MSEIKPESQPSHSGDAMDYKQEALNLVLDLEGWSTNEKIEIVIKRLRSHDAKVSGQAEQRLRALLKAAKSVCCDCSNGNVAKDIAGDWIHTGREHGSWSGEGKKFRRTCQLSLYLRSEITLAEAALQESPSDK